MEPLETEADVEAVDRELDAVERALHRIDDGSYGTCVRCGRTLSPATLDDDPLVEHCPEPCAG